MNKYREAEYKQNAIPHSGEPVKRFFPQVSVDKKGKAKEDVKTTPKKRMTGNSKETRKTRKMIAFTLQQELDDASSEYAAAIYRYRKAESEMSEDYSEAKREMNRLEKIVRDIRSCIYSETRIYRTNGNHDNKFTGCPKPEWNQQ